MVYITNREANAMNEAKRLICYFVEERLQGNLNELAHFDFAQLRLDKKYGAGRGESFDCDNTTLSKAIYLLVFKDVWNDLTFSSLENGLYRGDTINSFNTTFGKVTKTGGFAGLNRFNPDESLQQRVLRFHSLYHTIGNFMVLPNASVAGHTLNTFRGVYYQWRDYIDKFIEALHLQLIEPQNANNEQFNQLIVANEIDFEPYCHQEGFDLLMNKLLLNDYIDQDGKPKHLFDLIYHWDRQLTREKYLEHANHYLDVCESIIEKRGAKMVEIIASKLY